MTSIDAELTSKWSEAATAIRGGHEWRGVALTVTAPVRLIAAVREPDDRLALLIEGPVLAAPPSRIRFEAHGLSLTDQRRSEEKTFRIALTLERGELQGVFEALCVDLISVVSITTSPATAFAEVTKRLGAWQACLRIRKTGLSLEEQIGLVGELLVLGIIADVTGYPAAVRAWKGPANGIHDFEEMGTAIEVKSVLGIGTHIHISRIDQLEFAGLSRLVIARLRFRQGQDGQNLPSYVNSLRSDILSKEPVALADFDEKILKAGYLSIDERLYNGSFMHEGLCYYVVNEEFPRLVRHLIPTAIVDAAYTVDERAIAGFRKDGNEFRRMLKTSLENL